MYSNWLNTVFISLQIFFRKQGTNFYKLTSFGFNNLEVTWDAYRADYGYFISDIHNASMKGDSHQKKKSKSPLVL